LKSDEAARIAILSLPCLRVAVEIVFVIILDQRRKELRSAKSPQLANSNAGHYTFACISLKGFRVNFDKSCRLLAVQQPLEDAW
jgi:hypothetical protein